MTDRHHRNAQAALGLVSVYGHEATSATVGAMHHETEKAYIESQGWDEDEHGFKLTGPVFKPFGR